MNNTQKICLKIWNEEVEEAIQEKQLTYHKYLQTRTSEDLNIYKQKCNALKYIIREAHDTLWNRFISNLEYDVHGRQTVTYTF